MRTIFLAWAAIAILAMPNRAFCQVARARIDGPSKAAPGDLIVLDGGASQGRGFHWLLLNSERRFLTVEGGRKLVFASGSAQQYVFVLVVAAGDDAQHLSVDVAEHRVTVGDGPGPTPKPPVPDLPVGRCRFAAAAYRWTVELVPAAARHFAKPLAANFDAVRVSINAGAFRELTPAAAIKRANEQLKARNRATLTGANSEDTSNVRAWLPFFSAWQQKADSHNVPTKANPNGDGTLRTIGDYGQAYGETCAGLRAVVTGASAVADRPAQCGSAAECNAGIHVEDKSDGK